MTDFCILIQGPTNYYEQIKDSMRQTGVQIVYSTWVGEESVFDKNEIFVTSTKPLDSWVGNLNYQKITTLAGLLKVKELGFKRVLKWRSDMYPLTPDNFIKLFDNDKINFFAFHFSNINGVRGYIVDYFMSGDIDDMIKIWSFDSCVSDVPEHTVTNTILKSLEKDFNFVFYDVTANNDVYWIKYKLYLNQYQKIHTESFFDILHPEQREAIIKDYKQF